MEGNYFLLRSMSSTRLIRISDDVITFVWRLI
jgi:hypothetical protein